MLAHGSLCLLFMLQHDIKKREVQLERTLQHWQRVSSENARLLSAGYRTGLTCLNPIEAPEQAPRVVSQYGLLRFRG